MKRLIVFAFLSMLSFLSSAQSKGECLKYIKERDRVFLKENWISTELKGSKLIVKHYMTGFRGGSQYIGTYDLKFLELVEVEFDKEFGSWKVILFFEGQNYTTHVIDSNGREQPVHQRESVFLLSRCAKEEDAIKLKKMVVKLSTLI